MTVNSVEALMTALAQQLVPVAVEADGVLTLTQLEDPRDQSVIATLSTFEPQIEASRLKPASCGVLKSQ